MNSKTKLTLSVTAMVAITLLAIVSIMAVFAARQQSFSTSITVVYKSTSVEGTASAQWKLASSSGTGGFFGVGWNDMVSSVDSGSKKDLNLSDEGPLSLSPLEPIDLSDEHPAIAFKYVFTNTAERSYTLNFTYQSKIDTKNINIFYETASLEISDGVLGSTTNEFTNIIDTVVPGGATEYIYIVLRIDDWGIDSVFDGTFNIELNGLSSDYNEDYIYLFDGTNTMLVGTVNPNATTLDTTGLTYKGAPINKIRGGTFGDNTYLQNVILNGIEEIGPSAFSGCTGITNLTLGNNLAIIGDNAFYGCKNIKSITIPSSVISIGYRALNGCSSAEIIVDIGNEIFTSKNHSGEEYNCIIEKATKKLICGNNLSSIPEDGSIKTIGSYAFGYCSLDSLTIPQCIEHIEVFAFYYTSTSIINYYAENVADEIVGGYSTNVFGPTSSLSKDIILTVGENVKHIPAWLFAPCYSSYQEVSTAIINSADAYKELTGTGSNIAGDLLGAIENCNGVLKVKSDIVDGNDMPEYLKNNYSKGAAVDGYYTFTKNAA